MCLKRYLVLSLLLLVLLSPCYSDVVLSDAEVTELEEIFARLGNTLSEQATQIATLQAQLTTASEQLAISQDSMKALNLTLIELKKSYDVQRREGIRSTITWSVITAAVSLSAGLVVGLIVGN